MRAKWALCLTLLTLSFGGLWGADKANGDADPSWQQEVTPAALDFPKEEGSITMGQAFGRMAAFLGALIMVSILISVVKKRGRSLIGKRGSSAIRVVDTLTLGAKHYLAVVEYDGSHYLVGIAPNAISKISEIKRERRVVE